MLRERRKGRHGRGHRRQYRVKLKHAPLSDPAPKARGPGRPKGGAGAVGTAVPARAALVVPAESSA